MGKVVKLETAGGQRAAKSRATTRRRPRSKAALVRGGSPGSVARLTGASHGRDVVVAIAILGVLGMGVGAVNLARVRLRTPRPLR